MRAKHLICSLLVATLAACSAHPWQRDASLTPPEKSNPAMSTEPAAQGAAIIADRIVNTPTRRALRLTNGFTIILQQNKTTPAVAARIYIRAGALTEQQYMGAGISHVLEHLVAGATSGKRKEEENTLLLQEIGNDSNAYTDSDQTCYFITTTADKWPVALDLLVDWTTNANFTREQFEREHKVVQRELEMDEAEADRTFYLRTQANRYLVSPARHPVIGYKPAFQQLTFEDCKNYYAQMYIPDNMIVSIAGDIELDAAEKLIIDQLKNIRRKKVPAIALPDEPAVLVPRQSVSRADIKETRVEWAFPTTDMYSPDLYATDVLASVLGGGESSLLVRKLRDEQGLVFDVEASNPTPSYAPGQLTIDAVAPAAKIPAAQAALKKTLEELLAGGIPTDAIERAKAQAAATLVFGNQTAEQQAIRNALDFLATGNIDFTENYVARIQAVTPDQVLAAARKYLNFDRLLTTVVLPLNAPDPFTTTAATQAVNQAGITTQKTVLANGLTVLITRNTAAPLIAIQLYSLGGLLAESPDNNGIGRTMIEMLPRGTTTRTHEQITNFLDATGTTLSTESGNNSFSLAAQALKGHAAEAFDLFQDVALHPSFKQEELDQLRPQLLAGIEQSTEDWFDEAYKNTRDAFFTQSPYKEMAVGRAQVVSKLTTADLQKHHKEVFLDPKKMVLAIAGDIDPAAASAWAAKFSSIPQSTPALNLTSTPSEPRTLRLATRKESATVMFAFPPGMTITNPDRYAMTLLQTYLGGYSSPGGSVLHDTLRGQGLVYNVQATNFAGPAPGMFLIYTLGEPENVQKIVDTVQRIVSDAKAGAIPDAKLAAAKQQAITGELLSKPTIAAKASSAALDELMGLGYDEDARFPERIRAVTKADVVRVANKYLGAPVIVITAPEKK